MCVCRSLSQDMFECQPRWEVTLNNGEDIYMDDGNGDPPSAWLRLKKYCSDNSLWITNMVFGFRSNTRNLPNNAEGYFFCRSALGSFGSDRTTHFFIVGCIQDGKLIVTKWRVPEMLQQETEERDIKRAGECLIRRYQDISY